MELITILNRCHHFRGFVYHRARFTPDHKSIEVSVRPRKGSAVICSRCRQPAPGYDKLDERRFEFIPLWGYFVFLLYTMRRVDCRSCDAVVVEEVPWGNGKHTLTNVYMLFLARWARRLSWKETAEAFRTSWEKVFDAVEHVVAWGLEHRTLGQIDAIGVDEIQYAKGHKYLTLVRSTSASPACSGSARKEPSSPSGASSPPWASRSFPTSPSSARTCGSPISS
jgi:transposase